MSHCKPSVNGPHGIDDVERKRALVIVRSCAQGIDKSVSMPVTIGLGAIVSAGKPGAPVAITLDDLVQIEQHQTGEGADRRMLH